MADFVNKAVRSRMMSGIRGKDTKPELMVRRYLHAQGYRFRLHDRTLEGRPDLVLKKWQSVIFVHGCFWHRHPGCRYATTPATRPEFWGNKFEANQVRDERSQHALVNQGWRVAVVWECALKSGRAEQTLGELADWLCGNGERFETSI